MTINSKIAKTVAGITALLAYAWTEGAFCVPDSQVRTACENHPGTCEPFAWNYKVYYTKFYECCYNDQGVFTHKNVTGQIGPTPAQAGDCCQGLVNVGFDDGKWTLPCAQTHAVPGDPGEN